MSFNHLSSEVDESSEGNRPEGASSHPRSLIGAWNSYDEEGKRRLADRMVVSLKSEYEGAIDFNPNMGLSFSEWLMSRPGLNQEGFEEIRSFVIEAFEQSV